MAGGIAIVLDLLRRKNTSYLGNHCVRHYDLFSGSATAAASAAASSFVVTAPFATWAFFGKGVLPVAYCDAGVAFTEDETFGIKEDDHTFGIKEDGDTFGIKEDGDTFDIKEDDDTFGIKEDDDTSSIKELPGGIFQQDPLYYSSKEYIIELKPLFSAFQLKNLALTSLRSFLLFYLPLLEQHATLEEDDDDFLQDAAEQQQQQPDLTVPLKKSLKQIVRDTIVVTTRRVLERLAVYYVSQRMAWKLLKDASKSATRKAVRKFPTFTYFYYVSRTTFRAESLGILASWLVQVGIDVYWFFSRMFSSDEEEVNKVKQIQQLGGKICITSLRCGATLVFVSIGAGIGALLFKPSTGQWIGCAIGELIGPVIVSYCFRNILNVDL